MSDQAHESGRWIDYSDRHMSHGNSPRFNNLCSKVARFTGLTSRGDGLMPKKRNHRPRRMGNHGSVGNGISRVRAASNEAPTAHPNGRYQEAFSCRLPTWDSQPASRPSKVQALSRSRSTGDLSRIRARGWTIVKGPP